jgi:hypothetical protein
VPLSQADVERLNGVIKNRKAEVPKHLGQFQPRQPSDLHPSTRERIRKRYGGPSLVSHQGDNSNTQFAVLGLRAATEGGAELPKLTWERALEWYYKCQAAPYGGWSYSMGIAGAESWSMTCSGTVSITICLHALGKDEAFRNGKPLEVVRVKNGVDWLDKHWLIPDSVMKPGMTMGMGFYYEIYSLERVGMIVGLEKVGDHDWYAEGSARLLEWQEDDGSWGSNAIDTAFAILFLKKATRGYEVSPQDAK